MTDTMGSVSSCRMPTTDITWGFGVGERGEEGGGWLAADRVLSTWRLRG